MEPSLFDVLLEELQLAPRQQQDTSLQEAQMDPVIVHKKSQLWEFHLHVPRILPIHVYRELVQAIRVTFMRHSFIQDVHIVIHAQSSEFDEEDVQAYFREVEQLALGQNKQFQHSCVGKTPYMEDGKIYLPVSHLSMLSSVEDQFVKSLESAYQTFGFPKLRFHFIADTDSDRASQKEVEEHVTEQAEAVIHAYEARQQEKKQEVHSDGAVRFGKEPKQEPVLLSDLTEPARFITVQGKIFNIGDVTETAQMTIAAVSITDFTDSLTLKFFLKKDEEKAILKQLKKGMWIKASGSLKMDTYNQDELTLFVSGLVEVGHEERQDNAEEKRVELHAHTMMSQLDAPLAVGDLVAQAAKFGHPAVAITDHEVVQSFPDAYQAGKKHGVKILYGLEANVVDDGRPIAYHPQHLALADQHYVVFDVETTGFSAVYDQIIELSAVKMYKGNEEETFEHFIRADRKLSPKIVELTHITDELLEQKGEDEKDIIEQFMAFAEGCVLVAHNSPFDIGFLNAALERHQLGQVTQPVIDTLELARFLLPQNHGHRLNQLSKHYNVTLEQHHRAIYDAKATAQVFWNMFKQAEREKNITYIDELNQYMSRKESYKQLFPFHATILVKTQEGLKNLFKLVSLSHVKYYYNKARIPRSELERLREGLLVGSACDEGELFKTVLDKGRAEALEKAKFYDFIEVMPKGFYRPLIESEQIRNESEIEEVVKTLVSIGKELNKPVVATGNVHYLENHDKIYREVLMAMKFKGRHHTLPDTPYLTTEEMLEEFSYLGEDLAYEIVVTNPRRIAGECGDVVPVKDELYTPEMEGADDEIRELSYNRAHELYGEELPDIVSARLEKELHSIISNGFSVIYLIAQKLVHKSLSDGYLVGSRGSVGSSFVATMTGITEVNPLCPHYYCSNCQYSEFYNHGEYASGYDMPDKKCPHCGHDLTKEGQDIPFETFLGFHGDKVPDIDLNFSGSYQPEAHAYTKVLFGEDNVYRAGTIGTIAEKTALGYARGYEEDNGLHLRKAERLRYATGITGVKRTTGSHPGGIIVIPDYMDVYDFTPIQYPANKIDTEWRTTHFDFHSIHDNVLKLDILGHDDPTVIRMLQDLSGIDPKTIPADDPDVMKIFSGTESLGVTPEQIFSKTGTLGIPEFGTSFVRNMLEETKPTTFAELVQISGLSHGTDVWNNNAQYLIQNGIATLPECIGCRDDIMVYLMHHGLDDGLSFTIMESVRKGKGLSDEWQEQMREHDVPDWYIGSCLKIKYMFPKAHAAAYVLMAIRVAYFKVHFPLVYYCAYFSIRAKRFEIDVMCRGLDAVKARLNELYTKRKEQKLSDTESESLISLELANEMLERGYDFKMVDLYRSQATDFVIDGNSLIFPFVAVPDLGEGVAQAIVKERQGEPFTSKQNLRQRTHLSEKMVAFLDQYGVLEGLDEEDQLSLF